MAKYGQMRGQGVGTHAQLAGYFAGGQPVRPSADEKAENGKPVLLRKRGQGVDCGRQFHQQHARSGGCGDPQHALEAAGIAASSP